MSPVVGADAVAPLDAGTGTARAASLASPIAATAKQLITVVVPDWDATSAEIRLWHRDSAGWEPAGDSWQGVIGRTGAAWGAGLHGAGPPTGRSGPTKREGDGKSPAGVFSLGGSYGYGATRPGSAGFAYQQVDPSWKCVDDPKSTHYNKILDQRTTKPDWNSAEEMKRSDELYTWVIDIAHNAARVPGAGSCIFFHVWGGPGSATVGCTAMDASKLTAMMSKLDPAESPTLVLLPRTEYDALAAAWALPTK